MNNELATTDQVSAPEVQKNVINYTPIFPVLMAEVLLDLPIEQMVEDVLRIPSVNEDNYQGGFTTFFNRLDIDNIRGVKELKEAIYGISSAYGRELKFEANYEKCGIQVWLNVMRKGGHHNQHNHQRSVFSGTFYARVDEKMSPILFYNPTTPLRSKDPEVRPQDKTAFTSETMVHVPKNNTLVIWPAWLNHEVPDMVESGPRISFSFNVDYLPPGA